MVKRYHVNLTPNERYELEQVISRGKSSVHVITCAHILLKAAGGATDAEIVQALGTGLATLGRVRRRFAPGGLEVVLRDNVLPGRPRVLSSKQAAHLIAIACSDAPESHDHWPLRVLGHKLVELGYVEHISREMVRQVLKKKRAETMAPSTVVPASCGWRIRRCHGRCPRSLCRAV